MYHVILKRIGLENDLIPGYILECLYRKTSVDVRELTQFVDDQIGGASSWRPDEDLFSEQTLKAMVHERTIHRAIDFINQKLAAIDNTKLPILVAKIHKIEIQVDIGFNYVTHFALVHNVG